MLTKERNEVLCLIKDTVTERKITYFSPIFDGAEQHKAVSKTLLSLGEDSSTLRNADVISTDTVSWWAHPQNLKLLPTSPEHRISR